MMRDFKWSGSEKAIARKAFEAALKRELDAIVAEVKRMVLAPDFCDPWKIDDFLSARRKEVDQKYDYRYSVLPDVFARLIFDGWLAEAELEGLGQEKLDHLEAWLRFARE